MTIRIEYEVEERFLLPYERIIHDVVKATLKHEGCPYEVSLDILITDDQAIREMNREFRGIDAPTDVLSFPMADYESPSDFTRLGENKSDYFDPESGELLLGDVVISLDKVKEQAKEYGHSKTRELAFLMVHSMLHLCGYDHMEDEERLEMEKRQEEILLDRGYLR